MSEKREWHAWVIRRNRLDNVVAFIREHCPEVDKFFYPLIKKEYQTKSGALRVRDMPLYEGYLFLRYFNHPRVFHLLSSYPQVTTYCGPVTEQEITRMEEAQGKLLSELRSSRFTKGDHVILKDGPFKDYEAEILSANGEIARVRINATILGFSGHEVVYPETQLEHKTELQNAEVRDI